MIAGCYRRDEAHDPDTFITALTMVLDEYPVEIVEYVSDPRTGVINRYPLGLPQVAQIREFCESQLAKMAQQAEYQARVERQFAERDADVRQRQHRRRSYDDLKAHYGDGHGGWFGEGAVTTEKEKQAFLENAKQTGAEIASMKLSDEAKALLK